MSSTRPFQAGTALPPTCSVGAAFFKTDAPAGSNLYGCTAPNVWTLQSGGGGGAGEGLPSMPGNSGRVLSTDGTSATWTALGGDLTGTPGATVVERIRGRQIGATAPTDGQVLQWNAASSQWEPRPTPAAGSNYSQAFTSQTTVSISGAAHGLNTANLVINCYDGATPAARVEPNTVTVHPTTYAVTITFSSPQSGRCVVNGSGASFSAATNASNSFAAGTVQTIQGALVATSADRTAPAKSGTTLPAACVAGDQFFKSDATPGQNLYFCTSANTWTQMTGSGAGAVASVFGRSGAVTAQAGDYSFPQIAGTIGTGQLPTGIDAAKIGAGTVSNTEFGYMANLTSDVQAQLNAKAASTHSHTGGGDISGDVSGATVGRIQGRAISASAPSDGQALVWSAGLNAWQPGTVSGSGGGATMASQLTDFGVVRTSPTILTIGSTCTATTPCNVRFGNTVYSITRSCTATISAGTGTAFIYVASGGTVTVGHNATVAVSAGCLAQPSVTQFPADSVPLYSWTAASGNWDAAGGRDFRAWLSQKGITAGTGLTTLESGGRTIAGVDTATVPTYITGTAVLNFPSIEATRCSNDLTFGLIGATVSDAVAPGWPGALETGLLGLMRVSSSNTIAVRVCNLSASAIDPASAAFRATIVRSF